MSLKEEKKKKKECSVHYSDLSVYMWISALYK